MEDDTLFLQLHKLSTVKSEEAIEHILETLWKTRKTGLSGPEKVYIQSLFDVPSIEALDPVLACLRSLIRKCIYGNFTADDILKLFPPDLSLDLQTIILLLLQKYQNQWKEDASREQSQWPRARVSYQVKVSMPPSFTPSSASEVISSSMWPRHNIGTSTPFPADINVSRLAPMSLQQDDGPPDSLRIIPRLKSMTWTMENQNSTPTNRVAVISLKLQDYTKSSSGETEVRFQLTRDTLEAMLRSMTYINEQLANIVEHSAGPLQKKQRQ